MRAAEGQIEIPHPPTVDSLQTRPAKKTGDNYRRRSNSPGRSQKIFFTGCWHCSKEGEPKHSRQNCPEFVPLLEAANPGVDEQQNEVASGYMGACEKARKAAGLKPKEQRRLNMLDDEECDDSDTDSEVEQVPGKMCALRETAFATPPPTPHQEPRPQRGPRTYRDAAAAGLTWSKFNETAIIENGKSSGDDRPVPRNWSRLNDHMKDNAEFQALANAE